MVVPRRELSPMDTGVVNYKKFMTRIAGLDSSVMQEWIDNNLEAARQLEFAYDRTELERVFINNVAGVLPADGAITQEQLNGAITQVKADLDQRLDSFEVPRVDKLAA